MTVIMKAYQINPHPIAILCPSHTSTHACSDAYLTHKVGTYCKLIGG